MKLLFDQNLSFKLCDLLQELFPGSSQVRMLGLDQADDLAIWRRAAEDGYVLVTQDADFRDIAALKGTPPQVVLLRCGNRSTDYIAGLIRTHAVQISALSEGTEIDCLEIA